MRPAALARRRLPRRRPDRRRPPRTRRPARPRPPREHAMTTSDYERGLQDAGMAALPYTPPAPPAAPMRAPPRLAGNYPAEQAAEEPSNGGAILGPGGRRLDI